MDSNSPLMEIWLPLAVAAVVQASFSLGLSVLTLLSGSTLSSARPKRNLGLLSFGYILGFTIVTASLLVNLTWLFSSLVIDNQDLYWSALAILSMFGGFAVLLFYYRNDAKGTRLWLPRKLAEYAYSQTKQTKSFYESFTLGGLAVILELMFIVIPLSITAKLLSTSTDYGQYVGICLYSVIAVLPLVALSVAYSRGYKVGSIQRWRDRNKKFMQVMAGALMIVLGFYLLTYKVSGGSL